MLVNTQKEVKAKTIPSREEIMEICDRDCH